MRLIDIVKPECVVVPLDSADKQAAIFELADALVENTQIAESTTLRDAIWQRELTRTTGIGYGIAIPHGKCAGVDKLHLAIGRTARPLDFGAIDGKPVELIFLLASPEDQTGPHMQALGCISRMLVDDTIRDRLRACPDAASLYQTIHEYETTQAV